MQDDEILYIHHNGADIRCVVKRSARRKTVAISVKPDTTVILHAPLRSHTSHLQRVLNENHVWICNTIENARRLYAHTQSQYTDGDNVLYLGTTYTIQYVPDLPTDVHIDTQIMRVRAVDTTSCRLAIMAFYRKQAKQIFYERTAHWIPRVIGASPHTKIVIKHMTSRWGSMSSTGRMNLNIALVRTPMACIDYVIVHELCHQDHPHHQKSFWDAVRNVIPDYATYKRMLQTYPTEY